MTFRPIRALLGLLCRDAPARRLPVADRWEVHFGDRSGHAILVAFVGEACLTRRLLAFEDGAFVVSQAGDAPEETFAAGRPAAVPFPDLPPGLHRRRPQDTLAAIRHLRAAGMTTAAARLAAARAVA